jgi:hypothetical protein
MLEQIQTTIRIFILVAAGVVAVALARPPAEASGEALPNASPELTLAPAEASRHAPHAPHTEGSGFAIFCPDRR